MQRALQALQGLQDPLELTAQCQDLQVLLVLQAQLVLKVSKVRQGQQERQGQQVILA